MAAKDKRYGTVTVRTHTDASHGASGVTFTKAQFYVDDAVFVENESGELVGFFPSVDSVTFKPSEEA
ncbi:hypothetical protein [Aminobacter ciceronei]|uniref:Uncharacterized protein n=1 Tax=Aminobacter ciceronei TaxID=150723 RepID=A0ABR6C0R5_9HYPH|nr:hypothetical protein [Aminobacter ciceronei]MBA8904886.1 hypothetical protein [Aminobacter ciceronei]MBA9018560.1 hypothetical protein [Aminobacter ciceronei]